MAQYNHPRIELSVDDRSVVPGTIIGTTALYAAIQSARGPDNKIMLVNSIDELNYYYGERRLSDSQMRRNLEEWLEAGGRAFVNRVLPYKNDVANEEIAANYSAIVLSAQCSNIEIETDVFEKKVKIVARYLSGNELNYRTDSELKELVIPTNNNDVATFQEYPLLVIRGMDRGEFFNSYGISFRLLSNNDNTYGFRTYRMSIFSSPYSINGTFDISFSSDAIDLSQQSMFIEDVIKTYSSDMVALFNSDNYEKVAEFIAGNEEDIDKIDILTGSERDTTEVETLHSDTVWETPTWEDGTTELDLTSYMALSNGRDGEWTNSNNLENLLVNAYSGAGDSVSVDGVNLYDTYFSDVLDEDSYPIDIIIDGNQTPPIKLAMSELAKKRGDLMTILDTGFTASYIQAIRYRSSNIDVNNYYTAIFTQDMDIRDVKFDKDIKVTSTYFLAGKIPFIDSDNSMGIHYTFVGPRRGTVTGFKNISWLPKAPEKEALYNKQINYIERDTTSTRFMSQLTSQKVNSALSNINAVRTLLRMKREARQIASQYQFEFNDSTTLNDMQKEMNANFKRYVSNRACQSVKATVYASDYDIIKKRANVKIEVRFTGILETVFVNFVVIN